MTRREHIEAILSPAIDVKAPYAKVMVDALLKPYDEINLPFATNTEGATIYFKQLINGAAKARSERDAVVAGLTEFAETWVEGPERDAAQRLLNYIKSGDAAGGKPFSK